MRKEFVKRVLAMEKSKSALCREYGISRPTGDKWIERYQAGECLCDHSRAPLRVATRTAEEVEQQIVQLRQKYPAIGAEKIKRILENQNIAGVPCARTIHNIFKRHGLVSQKASQDAAPIQRFEKNYPNEMWQADYKGHFGMEDRVRCHPLNILDDNSRFNLCIQAQSTESFREIQPVMQRLFKEYGLPFSFLCDNGNPWGTPQSTGFSKFEVWLMELGILTLHGRPRHPQTQGKEERFNGSFTRECLNLHPSIRNMAEAQRIFDEYRDFYNNIRPHKALDLAVPATSYTPSLRKLPERIEDWEYESNCQLCKVKETGFFNYRGQGYFLSEGFGGKSIGVRESHLPGQITLLFRQFRIGRIDVEQRIFTTKRAYLLENDPRN